MYRIFTESSRHHRYLNKSNKDNSPNRSKTVISSSLSSSSSSYGDKTRDQRPRNHHRASKGEIAISRGTPQRMYVQKSSSLGSLSTFTTEAETVTMVPPPGKTTTKFIRSYSQLDVLSPSQRVLIVDGVASNVSNRSSHQSKFNKLRRQPIAAPVRGIERKKCIQKGIRLPTSNSMVTDDTSIGGVDRQPLRRSKKTLPQLATTTTIAMSQRALSPCCQKQDSYRLQKTSVIGTHIVPTKRNSSISDITFIEELLYLENAQPPPTFYSRRFLHKVGRTLARTPDVGNVQPIITRHTREQQQSEQSPLLLQQQSTNKRRTTTCIHNTNNRRCGGNVIGYYYKVKKGDLVGGNANNTKATRLLYYNCDSTAPKTKQELTTNNNTISSGWSNNKQQRRLRYCYPQDLPSFSSSRSNGSTSIEI